MDHETARILFPQKLLKVIPKKIPDCTRVVDVPFDERKYRIDDRQIEICVFKRFSQELE